MYAEGIPFNSIVPINVVEQLQFLARKVLRSARTPAVVDLKGFEASILQRNGLMRCWRPIAQRRRVRWLTRVIFGGGVPLVLKVDGV